MKRTPLQRTTPLVRRTPLGNGVIARPAAELPDEDVRPAQRPGGRPRAGRTPGRRPAGNPIPAAARALVRHRSGGWCEVEVALVCAGSATEQHHRQRRRDGGHAVSNLLDACSPCHRHIHAHPRVSRQLGWIVSAFEAADLQTVPLHYRRTPAVVLLDDGTRTTDLEES